MNTRRLLCISFAALMALNACSPLASVHKIRPVFAASPRSGDELQRSEKAIAAGQALEDRDPVAAIGKYLHGIRGTATRLQADPNDRVALRDYNFALSRMLSVISRRRIAAWSHPLQLPAADGGGELSFHKAPQTLLHPEDYDLIPVDQLSIGGTAFGECVKRDGLGAPLVAVNREGLPDYRAQFLSSKSAFYGITAVARFEGRRCIVTWEDPVAVETVNVNGHAFPLAADFSTAPALMLAKERPDRLGLVRLVFPEKYDYTAHISRLQPFDRGKIPVLFVHGLQDTAATWARMINTLRADPEIRRHYQFWVFSYPSGYPFPYSAMLLRRDLDDIRKAYPAARRMVLVGHSMGGLVSRLMVTDAGDKIWHTYFKKSPAQTSLLPNHRALLTEALIFSHRPEVARVIFISTPHHGSDFAANWIGRLASAIVRTPVMFVSLAKDALQATVRDNPGVLSIKRIPNSIDTLSPDNRFLRITNTLPITPGVPYHSIIGDRGRGDTPYSSDGVVPYWSSHIRGAASECIVPSGHDAHQTPQGIAEVRRILKLHLHSLN